MNERISSKDNQMLAQENAALRKEVNILKEQLALLQEQFDWLKKQVFGRKTEQTSVIMDGGAQLSLFPEEKEQAVSAPEKTVTVPEHQRKAKRTHDDWMSELPIEEIEATPHKDCYASAWKISVISHKFSLQYVSIAASNLCNLTKNLTAYLPHNLCAVLP